MERVRRVPGSTVFPQVFLVVAGLVLAAAGLWRVSIDRLESGPALAQACRILACNPNQPGYWADRLGDSNPDDQSQALEFSKLALRNDPASPFRWADLADLYMALRRPGDARAGSEYLENARACYRRAEELTPGNPNILQRIANFYFLAGQPAEALKRTSRILTITREFDSMIYTTYSRFGVTESEILSSGVPRDPAPARSYLDFAEKHQDIGAAMAAWDWASTIAPSPVTDELAEIHSKLLWRQGEFAEASQAMAAYLGPRAGDYLNPNRIFNGGFETKLSYDNPVDWWTASSEGVSMERDPKTAQQGQAAMRITFDGSRNLEFHHFGQTEPIAPGTYRFRAMVKTQGITTDQGPKLRIYDPEMPSRLDASTPAETGSSEWHAVELRVNVRPPTRQVQVEVVRQPSLKFDSKIAGTMWVDSVSLVAEP